MSRLFSGVMPFEWTTQTTIPNRMTMIACKGQNVTLGWKYNTSTTEHELTVEWFYRAPGKTVAEDIYSFVRDVG